MAKVKGTNKRTRPKRSYKKPGSKVKGTNKRTRPKRSYKKPGSKKGRGVRQTWKK